MLPTVSQEQADELVAKAHTICPYSKATRGNIEVTLQGSNGKAFEIASEGYEELLGDELAKDAAISILIRRIRGTAESHRIRSILPDMRSEFDSLNSGYTRGSVYTATGLDEESIRTNADAIIELRTCFRSIHLRYSVEIGIMYCDKVSDKGFAVQERRSPAYA